MNKKYVSTIAFAISTLLSSSIYANEKSSIVNIECDNYCGDGVNIVSRLIERIDFEYDNDTMFMFSDNGVVVNSMTFRDFLGYKEEQSTLIVKDKKSDFSFIDKSLEPPKTNDGSLRCENDPDYSCEEWEDYGGHLEPYLSALRNAVDNFEYRTTLTQAHLDDAYDVENFIYSFTVSVVTYIPVSRIIDRLGQIGGKNNEGVKRLLAAGITGAFVNHLFGSANRSKLRAGDVLIIKGNKLVGIIRNGVRYSARAILGSGARFIEGSGENSSSGGSGDGTGNDSSNTGGGSAGNTAPAERSVSCYRSFSSGQIIYVPCP